MNSKKREDFKILENKALIRNYEQIFRNLETKEELVVDARPSDDFNKTDPINGKENKIKGSKNVPYAELFDANASGLKNLQQIAESNKY